MIKQKVSFFDPKPQYRKIEKPLLKRVHKILREGHFILGEEVAELEKKLAEFAGVNYAVGCSSGTDALLMALMAYGIKSGDAVFTTPFTFMATAEAIALVGATPIFVDIDAKTKNLDPSKLQEAVDTIKKEGKLNPKAVIGVDLFGLIADYGRIMQITKKENLVLIEDAAQSFGASYQGKMAGSFGHIGVTSFFPAKPLGCYGDGGAVFVHEKNLYEELLSIRVHGQGKDKYENVRLGLNARLDTLQAGILLEKLKIFKAEIKRRQKIAEVYTRELKSLVCVPEIPKGHQSAWAQYSIETDVRDSLREFLQKQGIPTAIYYPLPLHLQKAFNFLGYGVGDFPIAEKLSKQILSLPMHPYLSSSQISQIVKEIRRFFMSTK